MASPSSAVLCAVVALVFWTALGFPVVCRLLPRSLALPFAPLAGWAMHSVVALPVFFVVPFSGIAIVGVALLALAAAWYAARFVPACEERDPARVPSWAYLAAALLAVTVAAAILPKHVGDAVILSDQVFDHAKVAMVDDMARLGLPPGNPFIAHDGSAGRLTYYYLLHFSAAELTRLLPVNGWEADIAMTFFAAFTSLAAMMGLAVRFAGRASAAGWVVAVAASSSSRVLLVGLFGGPALDAWFQAPGGFGDWLFQAPWSPQHLIATSCVLFAVLTMNRLAARPAVATAVVLALTFAAAFESSTWVGGIVLPLVVVVVAPLVVLRGAKGHRTKFVALLVLAAAASVAFAWSFLVDQYASSVLRDQGFPVALHPAEVLGPRVPESLRGLFDAPAFWLLMLPVAMSAAYIPGVIVLFRSLSGRGEAAARTPTAHAFAAVGLVALAIAWLLASTIAVNNDLGWRAALLGCAVLIVFAAVGLARWMATRQRGLVALALIALVVGLPEAVLQIARNVTGHAQPEGRFFAEMPALWSRVRAHTAIDERVANNPRGFEHMTPWPVNIAWSLLADRRSCYAGWELTQVFTAIPHDRLRAIDDRFVRVFAGEGSADDVRQMADEYDCAAVVITAHDGAWAKDPFAISPSYVLVEEDSTRWRIYRRRQGSTGTSGTADGPADERH
jgi:hypothetical protein